MGIKVSKGRPGKHCSLNEQTLDGMQEEEKANLGSSNNQGHTILYCRYRRDDDGLVTFR